MNNRIKVAYIHPNALDLRTANMRQVLQVCESFIEVGMEVELFVPHIDSLRYTDRLDLIQNFFKVDFKISTFRNSTIYRALGVLGIPQMDLRRSIKNFDIIFSRDASIVKRVNVFGKPILYEAHNSLFYQKGGIRDKIYTRKMKKYFNKEDNKIITISSALKNDYERKGFLESNLYVEHDCHDGILYDKNLISRELRLLIEDVKSNYDIIASYTGSLNEDRGLEIMCNTITNRRECFFLFAGGSSSQVNNWSRVFNGNDNCIVLKRLNKHEVKFIQDSADILLGIWSSSIPTINYCSPLKLFEYMAWGKPIVIPDFPTFYEVLSESNAFFYKKDDSLSVEDSFSNAVEASTNFDKTRLELLTLSRYYTWDSRALRIREIMKKMLKEEVD